MRFWLFAQSDVLGELMPFNSEDLNGPAIFIDKKHPLNDGIRYFLGNI